MNQINFRLFPSKLPIWLLLVAMVAGTTYSVGLAQVSGIWGDQGDGTYRNPVLWADYNNPEIIRVEDDFYMIWAGHQFMAMPVLHSKDLINWTYIGRIYDRLKIDLRYDKPGQHYRHGSWAPCMVYREGRFYVYFCTSKEGLFMTTATDPAGPWEPLHWMKDVADWEDPYPFWDDNGKAWLVHGAKGGEDAPLTLHRMSDDGKELLDDRYEPTVIIQGDAPKGPRIWKRHGYYWIFGGEGGLRSGYQSVYRSRSLEGPYERKVIQEQGSTNVNGPRQGPWIELANGDDYFAHFQAVEGYGRILRIQPARWVAGEWPSIGVDLDSNGVGEPVPQAPKPNVGAVNWPIQYPQSSDGFSDSNLGFQWRWNANPVDSAWSLTERPGFLRLYALPLCREDGRTPSAIRVYDDADPNRPLGDPDDLEPDVPFDGSILFAYNSLVQMVMGRESQATVKIDVTNMADGQVAGLSLFNRYWNWIGVEQRDGQRQLVVESNRINDQFDAQRVEGPKVSWNSIWLRAEVKPVVDRITTSNPVEENPRSSMSYSLDGETFEPLGVAFPIVYEWFEGSKYTLFTYQTKKGAAGWVDFDWFRYEFDGVKQW